MTWQELRAMPVPMPTARSLEQPILRSGRMHPRLQAITREPAGDRRSNWPLILLTGRKLRMQEEQGMGEVTEALHDRVKVFAHS